MNEPTEPQSTRSLGAERGEVRPLPIGSSHGMSEKPSTGKDLLLAIRESGLVGFWRDRTDISDGTEFARRLREKALLRGAE